MSQELPREGLVRALQFAYSGERAAGYAYRGHWRATREADDRERIRRIEEDEWHHRRLVGDMLRELQAGADPWRELRAIVVGRLLQAFCHVGPAFAAMYGAGRLESFNVKEYEAAAELARRAGTAQYVDCLLTMAETEWDHEAFFRSKVLGHPWLRVFRLWASLPPRETIRAARL